MSVSLWVKMHYSGMTRSITIVVKLASEIVCIEPYLGDAIKLILLWELPLP